MKLSILSSTFLVLALGAQTEAAASFDPTVTCDPSTPEICRGSLETYSPSPMVVEKEDGTYETSYVGGYHWHYTFVRGLPDGHSDPYSGYPANYGIYEYGPSVSIALEDDQVTCSVMVGNEECSSCEVCGAVGDHEFSFTADCANMNTQNIFPETGAGKLMECESVLPFFYPLEIPSDLPELPPPSSSPSTSGTTSPSAP